MDSAIPCLQATGLGMAERMALDEALAGAAGFAEGSGPDRDGAEATEEALDREPFIRLGEQATLQPTGRTT